MTTVSFVVSAMQTGWGVTLAVVSAVNVVHVVLYHRRRDA